MKLVPVDPKDVPNYMSAGRGHICYPILKQFMESNVPVSRLDRTGIPQSRGSVSSSLKSYAKKYAMPIRVFTRDGEVYLCRTDMDAEGKIIEEKEPADVTPEVIDDKSKGELKE